MDCVAIEFLRGRSDDEIKKRPTKELYKTKRHDFPTGSLEYM